MNASCGTCVPTCLKQKSLGWSEKQIPLLSRTPSLVASMQIAFHKSHGSSQPCIHVVQAKQASPTSLPNLQAPSNQVMVKKQVSILPHYIGTRYPAITNSLQGSTLQIRGSALVRLDRGYQTTGPQPLTVLFCIWLGAGYDSALPVLVRLLHDCNAQQTSINCPFPPGSS